MNFAIGVSLFIIGNIFAWFQFNSQFAWPWWRDKVLLSVLIYAVPMCLCFYFVLSAIIYNTSDPHLELYKRQSNK